MSRDNLCARCSQPTDVRRRKDVGWVLCLDTVEAWLYKWPLHWLYLEILSVLGCDIPSESTISLVSLSFTTKMTKIQCTILYRQLMESGK